VWEKDTKSFVLARTFIILYDKGQEAIMKSKTFGKKLVLNKNTVADLSIGTMKKAHGGGEDPSGNPLTACTCEYTGLCCPSGGCTQPQVCPTVCTCGSGDPLCHCLSIEEK